MRVFADAAEIDWHVGSLFRKALSDPVVGPRLCRAGVALRLSCHDPDCELVVRLHDPVSVSTHGASPPYSVTLGMHADVLEHFLRGNYSIVDGLARGEIEARGPVSRVLRVLPELECLFPHYREDAAKAGGNLPSPRRPADSLASAPTERSPR